jgi:hypothetical protein
VEKNQSGVGMKNAITGDFLIYHMLKGGVDKATRDAIGVSVSRTLSAALRGLGEPPALSEQDAAVISRLSARGFAPCAPLFSQQQLDEIETYLNSKPARFYNDNTGEPGAIVAPISERPAEARFATWDQSDICGCPAIMSTAHDERLVTIAEHYLRAPPTISIITVWWSYPSSHALGGMQHYHHDRDDFSSLKLFVYLTDVDIESGPHEFVDETHSFQTLLGLMKRALPTSVDQGRFLQWMEVHRKRDEDVIAYFPAENLRTITGPRGSTFFEDTRGLHRGLPPVSRGRLCFEICYTHMPKLNMTYTPIARSASMRVTPRVSWATRLYYK